VVRVLVDTNLFISHLLHPQEPELSTFRLVQALLDRTVTHVLLTELLNELERAVQANLYLSERIRLEDLQEFRESLWEVSEVVTLGYTPVLPILRDRKDDYLLAASWKFAVDLLVTGDRDFLDVRDVIDPPRIVTAAEFMALLPRSEP
jgi:putative PIN family toxin of toxin-antitoxin system